MAFSETELKALTVVKLKVRLSDLPALSLDATLPHCSPRHGTASASAYASSALQMALAN